MCVRRYVAVVKGDVLRPGLGAELAAGVATSEGAFCATLVAAKRVTCAAVAGGDAGAGGASEADRSAGGNDGEVIGGEVTGEVTLVVTEGKYRMVRRVLANVGHPVLALHRTRLACAC